MSLVLVAPSMSRRSNVVDVAARRAASAVAASTTASVVTTTSIVARLGAIIPAPLAKPPTVQPWRVRAACLSTVSVVSTAVAAAVPASSPSASSRRGVVDPGEELVDRAGARR